MGEFDPRSSATAAFALRDKKVRFERIQAEAEGFGLEVEEIDDGRPWGGFVKFKQACLEEFIKAYWTSFMTDFWQEVLRAYLARAAKAKPPLYLDAKLLLVAPGQRLSLQSHTLRSELWRVLEGPVVVVTGTNEEKVSDREVRPGEVIRIGCGQLHRLAAPPSGWGVVAEIWLHESAKTPSYEADIRRYDDDYWFVAEDPPAS